LPAELQTRRFGSVPAAGLFTFQVTGSGLAVAIVSAARSFPLLLTGAFIGVLSEAVNRKQIVVGGLLLTGITFVLHGAVDGEALDFNCLTSKAYGNQLHSLMHDLANPDGAGLSCCHADFHFFLDGGDLGPIGMRIGMATISGEGPADVGFASCCMTVLQKNGRSICFGRAAR
jgi:hypothetical protein